MADGARPGRHRAARGPADAGAAQSGGDFGPCIGNALRICAGHALGGPGEEEGLALLSRWPLHDAKSVALPHATELERRIVLGALAQSPLGPLPIFTTHLNWRMTDGVKREDQVVAVEAVVAQAAAPTPCRAS